MKERARSPKAAPRPQLTILDGREVWVTRKAIKNIHLRIKPPDGRIEVSAPLVVSDREIERFIQSKRSWIEKAQTRILADPANRESDPTPEQKQQWKEIVSAFVPVLIEKYEPILGVKAGKVAYRLMKSRWGSCQPATGRICINTRLAL